MVFLRKQHDGLWGVINRQGFSKITFIDRKYETTDKSECDCLIGLGYAHEGEAPEDKKSAPKVSWVVKEIDSGEEIEIFDKKKDAEAWLLGQDNATKLEIERQEE